MSENTKTKEWTLMFYFASDNPLAPGIVSQLKSLKNAGYHQEANVVAYFDPEPAGTPTHIFDVNSIYKLKKPDKNDIGFAANDPFVRDLMEDKLWGNEKSRKGKPIRELIIEQYKKNGLIYDPPKPPPSTAGHAAERDKKSGPEQSLGSFLNFCADKYPAKHYMLFILGHGLVVGDDVFLFDEHAATHSVTLRELGKVLGDFKRRIKRSIGKAEFELVSFHSCSMSSLEVAFQLQGTANYMLASQGPAFAGSWPYRQILIRVFKDLKDKLSSNIEIDVKKMLVKIFDYVYHNSTDYLLAGYSFDLCLFDLSKRKITAIAEPIKALSDALVAGMKEVDNPLVRYFILLAHWESQSYWKENYTDFYDFCFCLNRYCQEFGNATEGSSPYQGIQDACDGVMDALMKPDSDHPNNPVIRADIAGPDSQYSHGLSVFFPWTRPTSDKEIMRENKQHKTEYERYKFNQTGWFTFLDKYWGPQGLEGPIKESTMRVPHKDEDDRRDVRNVKARSASEEENLHEDIVSLMFNAEGPLNNASALSDREKVSPQDRTGDECNCGSIKNYLRDTRTRRKRGKSANEQSTVPVNQTISGD